jgi:hypothetical protein
MRKLAIDKRGLSTIPIPIQIPIKVVMDDAILVHKTHSKSNTGDHLCNPRVPSTVYDLPVFHST